MMGGPAARPMPAASGGARALLAIRYKPRRHAREAFAGRTVEIDVPNPRHLATPAKVRAQARSRHVDLPAVQRPRQGARGAGLFHHRSAPARCARDAARIIEQPCTDCGGQGRRQEHRKLSVDIPKGIEDGTRIRLANEGEAGLRGGPPGDLYIFNFSQAARSVPA